MAYIYDLNVTLSNGQVLNAGEIATGDGGGGTTDAYTKAETDALLANKSAITGSKGDTLSSVSASNILKEITTIEADGSVLQPSAVSTEGLVSNLKVESSDVSGDPLSTVSTGGLILPLTNSDSIEWSVSADQKTFSPKLSSTALDKYLPLTGGSYTMQDNTYLESNIDSFGIMYKGSTIYGTTIRSSNVKIQVPNGRTLSIYTDRLEHKPQGGSTLSYNYPSTSGTLALTSDISTAISNQEILITGVPETATEGTLTSDQMTALQSDENHFIVFNNEKYYLQDKGHQEGYITLTHVGYENNQFTLKAITIPRRRRNNTSTPLS